MSESHFSTTRSQLQNSKTDDVPAEYFAELDAHQISSEDKGDCERSWGNSCVRPDGSVGQMVTLTCTFTRPDGSTYTQTRTWCSSGSG